MQEETKLAVKRHLTELLEDGVTVIKKGIKPEQVLEVREQFKAFANLNSSLFHKHLDADGHYQKRVTDRCLELGLQLERVEVEAGDTVIWHPRLPHGGSHIEDITRSRHSLVIHGTPVGVPVCHQDVFFNPSKVVPSKAAWDYKTHDGRKYAVHSQIEFAHQDPTAPSAFRQL